MELQGSLGGQHSRKKGVICMTDTVLLILVLVAMVEVIKYIKK